MSDIRYNSWYHRSGTGGVHQASNGRVGIGSTIPQSTLDLSGGTLTANEITGVSTIGVTTVTANTLNVGLTTITSDSLQVNGTQYPSFGPLSNRNLIINGAMQVGQRDNVANETAAVYGKVDRYRATVGGSTNKNYNFSQVTGCVPQEGFPFGLEYENINSVTPGADDFVAVSQVIEGKNLQSIRKGTAKAQPITLSFWARSSRTGTYVVDLYDADNDRQTGQSYSLEASIWKHVVLTFPADTTGAFDNDFEASLYVNWWLGGGSDFTGGASLNTSWQVNVQNQRLVGVESTWLSTAGSTFNLTGVQLEVGSVATPFEYLNYGDDLFKCERYHQIIHNCFSGDVVSGTTYRIVTNLDPRMRGDVSITTAFQQNASRFGAPATTDLAVEYQHAPGTGEIGALRFDKTATSTGVGLCVQRYNIEAELGP